MEEEKEIELVDFLNIIWKRKWLIILPTLFFVTVIGIISFLMPKVWEVDAIIVPSQILVEPLDGRFEEFLFDEPQQITKQINEGAFSELIAAELKTDPLSLSKIKAENFVDTKLIQIKVRDKDIDRAKLILLSLFKHLKKELDVKAETEKVTTEEEIKSLQKNINAIKQRIEQIEAERKEIRKRIASLENEKRLILKKNVRSESENLGLLLYSSEIQENMRDYSALNIPVDEKRKEEQKLNTELEERLKKIKRKKIYSILKRAHLFPLSCLS